MKKEMVDLILVWLTTIADVECRAAQHRLIEGTGQMRLRTFFKCHC
jgi:hypothetical protein